ncbi:hypothetical protein UCRPA7_7252 [Phaeoacremonium minimum UCRPA7]|uniref:Uncharacterized protein n=1 Tax=Phaeoacremonium minimum (strain UCR-PA7) TaxID=1286976 RepID=R8BD76_PHAM7|nr:hypothetical protein UCRPA7_7252 [Phaeoacremonium minimum UCRPA7]EON97246.1 hypothetical protein UCRPA7_7252 [Phaeoacremonium minimum UCRPA7]
MDTPEFAHIPTGASSLPDDAPTQAWDPYGSDLEDGEIQEDEPSGNGDSMDQDNTSLKSGEASPSPPPSDSTPSSSSSSSGDSASRGAILLRAVHDACLMATQRYLRSHHSNWRLRKGSPYPPRSAAGNGSSPAGCSPHSTQSSPHGSSAGSDAVESHGHRNSPLGSPPRSDPNNNIDTFVPTGTDSVLANTAAICTLMWRRAQATRLLSLGAESAAIADMRKLTVWAEVVVLTSRRARVAPDPALAVAYIIAAGRALCRFLEDEDALAMIDDALPIQWIEVDLDLDYLGSLVH